MTIIVYVDDFLLSCKDGNRILQIMIPLEQKYGKLRTTTEKVVSYLGCSWNFTEDGYVTVSQVGMIQDLIKSRENTLISRGEILSGNPHTPSATYIFERSADSPLLTESKAKTFHTDVATALYLANRTRPDIVLTIGELCKRVKSPTEEDDKKLNRLIAYLRSTRDTPLRLGCSLPPQVTVSVDASFANREEMKSTSGACTTMGTGVFSATSKIRKINSKSSMEAEVIASSDNVGMPLWLRDFLICQGYPELPVILHQDNQSAIKLLTKGRSTADATRFISIRYYWLSDYIKRGLVSLLYVPTAEMTSDYFTKPVQGALFSSLIKKIMGNK